LVQFETHTSDLRQIQDLQL